MKGLEFSVRDLCGDELHDVLKCKEIIEFADNIMDLIREAVTPA